MGACMFTQFVYLWNVLQLYDLGGRLVKDFKSFYMNSRTCVRV